MRTKKEIAETEFHRVVNYELEAAAQDILGCCELNLDELEPETIEAIRRLNDAIEASVLSRMKPKGVERCKKY